MKFFLLPAALALSGLAGCTDDTLGLAIDEFEPLSQANMCGASATTTVTAIQSFGTFDVALQSDANSATGYVLVPVVVNHLLERSTGVNAEMDAIDVTGFDIELQPAPEDTALSSALLPNLRKYFIPLNGGRIKPGGDSSVAIPVEVIPVNVAKVMNQGLMGQGPSRPLIIHMRPTGIHAGLQIVGGFTNFPVTICRHCLGTPDATCPAAGYQANTINKDGCFPWADFPATCCFQGTTLLCGTQVPVAKSTP
jgi:hypothetical protein